MELEKEKFYCPHLVHIFVRAITRSISESVVAGGLIICKAKNFKISSGKILLFKNGSIKNL